MGQVGLEPTIVKLADLQSAALATRRLTHIVVIVFMVGQVGLEPTMVKPTDLQSAALAARRLTHIGREFSCCGARHPPLHECLRQLSTAATGSARIAPPALSCCDNQNIINRHIEQIT